MYCNHCGTQYADTDRFCPNCGAPAGRTAPAASAPNAPGRAGENPKGSGLFELIAIPVQLLIGILWFVGVIGVSHSVWGYGSGADMGMPDAMSAIVEPTWPFTLVTVILCLLSMVTLLLRVSAVMNPGGRPYAAIAAGAWYLLWYVAALIVISSRSRAELGAGVTVVPTLGGWIYLAACAGFLTLLFLPRPARGARRQPVQPYPYPMPAQPGQPLQAQVVQPRIVFCANCGTQFDAGRGACPNCGLPHA